MLKRLLLSLISLITFLLVMVFSFIAYLQFADLSRYKHHISQRLSLYLSRSVELNGDFDIGVVPPSLSLSNVTISNAVWGSTPNMLTVHQLDLQLGLLPLLSGEFLVTNFVLNDVEIVIENNDRGENNWQLREPKEKSGKTKTDEMQLPLDFSSDVQIDVRDITISFKQLISLPAHRFTLTEAQIEGINDRNALQIHIAGEVDGNRYQLDGYSGRLAELLSPEKEFPLELQARALNTDWQIKGVLENALQMKRMQFGVKASANDLTSWKQWLGFDIRQGPVKLQANIEGNLDRMSVTELVAQLGAASASGDAVLDMTAERPAVIANLQMNEVRLEEFLSAVQPAEQRESHTQPEKTQSDPLSDSLDLSFLNHFDSVVKLRANTVGYLQWTVDQFIAEMTVKNGRLAVASFSAQSSLGQINGSFNIAGEQNTNVANLEIEAKELALGKFFNVNSTYQGRGAVQGKVQGRGSSFRDLFTNLQGNAVARYVNKQHQHDTKIGLRRLNPKTSDSPFVVTINGELQKVPYEITGEIGGPLALISDEPYPVTARLAFLNVDAKAKGTIARLFRAEGFDIAFDARTENLAKVNQKFNIGLPDLNKTQVQAVLRGDYSTLKFDKINANTNSAQASGNVQLDFKEKPLNITGNLTVNKFDLADMQKEISSVHKVKDSERAKSQESLMEKTMSFSALHGFNMNIKLNTDSSSSINLPNFPITKFDSRISVANSTLSVSPMSLESPMGNIAAEFTLAAKDKVPLIEAKLKSSRFNLERLELDGEEQLFREALMGADLTLRTRGDSLRHWLENVTGNVTLNYQHKQLPQTYVVRLVRESQADVLTAPVSVHINTKIGDTTSQGLGSVSAPYTWLQGSPPTKMDFAMNVKGYDTQVQGEIDDLVSGDGMDLRVSFNNRRLMTETFDPNDLVNKIGKVQLLMAIKGNYSSIVASQLDGVVGKGKITGSASVNFREQPTAVDFDLNVDDLDISKWATVEPKSSASKTKPGRLFSNEKLPFNALKAATIKGKIDGDNIQFKRMLATKLVAAIDLREGVLKFDLSRLLTNQGELSADLVVDSNETPPKLSLKLDVPTLNMAEFARNTAAEGFVNGDFSADISLNSAGNSIAELAAGLDGHMRLLMGKGTIDSALLNIYTGGLSAMVGMLTAANVKTTRVNCGICGLEITKGKAVSEVVLLDTQHSTLVAEGWIDFVRETLSVKASPVKKGLRLNTELPVVIQGDLSDPKVSTQPTSALNTAAEIATVWFIPTTALFIAYDTLRSGDKNPCVNMVAPTKEGAGLRALKGAGKAFGDIGSVFSKGLSTLLGGNVEQRPQGEGSTK